MFPILESLDAIEEPNRKFFDSTEDGKFKFNQGKYDTAIKTPLITKRDELLGKVAKYKDLDDADLERIGKLKTKAEKLAAFDEWVEAQDDHEGDDPDDPKGSGKDKKKPLTEKEIRAAVQAERQRLTAAHTAALKTEQDRVTALEQKFEQRELDLALDQLAIEHGVIGKRLATWKAAVKGRFTREDGEIVFLENGKPSTTTTAEQAVRDVLFKEFDYLYEAREAGGGGGKGGKASKGDGSGRTISRSSWDKLSESQRDAQIKKGVQIIDD